MFNHHPGHQMQLAHVVQITPAMAYPIGTWFRYWFSSVLLTFFTSILAILILLPASPLVLVLAYFYAGWRLNRKIFPVLQIDPYHCGNTVSQVLNRKLQMLWQWPTAWPLFFIKLWFARVL